jgi:F0F1-type ATP synthase assembly protein I
MQLGLTMAGCIIFCFFVGWFIDKWLGTRGIFVTIFIILGVLGGGNVVYRQIMDLIGQNKDGEANNRE